MTTRVLIADDHKIMRDGLRSLLSDQGGFEVVGEAENGLQAVQLARETSPDVVIMDVAMPDLNGMDASRQILESLHGAKVVALSMHADRRFVAEMLRAGASGYVLKHAAFEELVAAIRAVTVGRTYLSSSILDVVVSDYVRKLDDSAEGAHARLTDRERQVLQLVAEGHNTKEVALTLNVSVKTVETHRQNIMNKLEVHSLAGLTKFAVREGLTGLEE